MQWLTLTEAAERLGQSQHLERTLVRNGRLPAYRFTRRLPFKPEEVDQLVADGRVNPIASE